MLERILPGAGAGSGLKIPGARAVQKQAGSETLAEYLQKIVYLCCDLRSRTILVGAGAELYQF